MLEAVLYVTKRGRLAYPFLDDFRRELAYHHAVLQFSLHEAWLHHLAAVGNGIVERQGTDGRKHGHVTDAHPWQIRLAPVTALVLWMRDIRLALAHEGKVEGNADAFAMQTIDIGGRIVAVSLIDDAAYAYVTALPEDVLHLEYTIAATVPVVVLHLAAMHVDDARGAVHLLVQGYLPVLKSHHDAGCLERRARLPEVAHGIVLHLVVLAVLASGQVDDGLHVACLHFHHNGNTHLTVHKLFLQLAAQGAVGKVLYVDVDGGEQVMPVLCLSIYDGNPPVAHGDEVLRAGLATKDAVETQLQTALGLAACIVVKFAYRAACQSAIGFEAEQHLVGMEATLVHALPEEWQILTSTILNVAGQLGIDAPGVLAASLSLQQALAEPLLVAVGEDVGQSLCNTVQVNTESRVAESPCLCLDARIRVVHGKVHIESILRHSAREDLPVARKNVTTIGRYLGCLAVASHLFPIITLRRQHRIESLSQDIQSGQEHHHEDEDVASGGLIFTCLLHCGLSLSR